MVRTGDDARRLGGWAFVGRDREVAELAAALEDAVGGRGRLFLIAGEPGIGKTALAEHLTEQAPQRGAQVVWGRCWEGGGAPPYWPWMQVIRDLAGRLDDRSLRAGLGVGAPLAAQLVPDLTRQLGTTGAAPAADSEAGRFLLFEAVAGLVERASSLRPLLLVLDDLHAADLASLLLLRFLARDLRGLPVLAVGTYREAGTAEPAGIGHALADLVREGHTLNLRGLGRSEVEALVGQGSVTAAPEGTVAAIHAATEGNPLFVRELLRLLAAGDALQRPGRPRLPIPGSVRAVIRQRLAPLSADAVQVLSAAAVVGRDFDLALVAPACQLPVEQVLAALSEAAALGIVGREAGAVGRWRFAHPLMWEVLYESLPLPARTQLHRQVGEAIEARHGDIDAHIAELAHHFTEAAPAGEAAKALAYNRRAGDLAMAMHAYERAAVEYQWALQALAFVGPDEAVRGELLLRLGYAQARAGAYREARDSLLQAAEASRTLGASEQLAHAALGFAEPQVEGGVVDQEVVALVEEALDALGPGDAPLRVRLLARLSVELTSSQEPATATAISRDALAMARRLGDPTALGSALRARWLATLGPDGLAERSTLAEELISVARELGDRELELIARARRATTRLEAGELREVQADVVAYTRSAGDLRMPVYAWTATTMQAMQALLAGSLADAERLAEEARSLQPEGPNVQRTHLMQLSQVRWQQGRLRELWDPWRRMAEQRPQLPEARGWLALSAAHLDPHGDARQDLHALADDLPELVRDGGWLPAVTLACLAAGQLEDPDAAERLYPLLAAYDDHIVVVAMPHPVLCLGSASLALGLLATITGRWAEAGEHFQTALDAHERLRATPWLARSRYEHARMLLRRGRVADRDRAGRLLQRALGAADALGMAALAEDIRALQAAPAAAGTSPAVVDADDDPAGNGGQLFRREGEFWTVRYQGSVVRLKDSKGLRHLARLLAHPGQEFHATDLEAAEGRPAPAFAPTRAADHGLEARADLGDAGELLDAPAKAAYKARLEELREELEEAERFNDPARATKARQEIDFLVEELARAVGLGGRDRRAASHAERARLNATRAIRSAMANLARAHPELGAHLSATVRTGRYCSYTPDPRAPITWAS